jgi:hypothetical protein
MSPEAAHQSFDLPDPISESRAWSSTMSNIPQTSVETGTELRDNGWGITDEVVSEL